MKRHILEQDHVKAIQNLKQWYTYASASGMGERKKLEVEIGGDRYRVTDHDKVIYLGRKADIAVKRYNLI